MMCEAAPLVIVRLLIEARWLLYTVPAARQSGQARPQLRIYRDSDDGLVTVPFAKVRLG
jgi:hypothetical protein